MSHKRFFWALFRNMIMKRFCWHWATTSVFLTLIFPVVSQKEGAVVQGEVVTDFLLQSRQPVSIPGGCVVPVVEPALEPVFGASWLTAGTNAGDFGVHKGSKPVNTCLINRTTGKKIRLLLPQSHVNFIGPCLIFNSVLFFAEYIYARLRESWQHLRSAHLH